MKRLFGVIILFGLALSLVACGNNGGVTLENVPTPTPLPTPIVPEKPVYTVQAGTVVNALIFNGRVSPVVEEQLAFGREGTVKTVYASQGDMVQAGDVLAELDITELEKSVLDAEIGLQTAQFNLEKARLEHTETLIKAEIDIQRELLNAQKAALEQPSSPLTSKQLELQSAQDGVAAAANAYQVALTDGNIEQSYVDSLARGLEQAEQQLLNAEVAYNDQVRALSATGVDAQIKELDRILAEMAYEKLLLGIEPSYEVEVSKAQATLEEAQGKLSNAKLVAPFNGRILSVSIKRGDQVQAFKAVIVVAQMDALELTANLNAAELAELSIGQQAAIQLRNRPEETLSGEIRTLPYPYGGGSGSGADENEETVARISIDQDVALTLGELAEVTITLEKKDGVLWLPPAAIRRFQGRRFVVVQDGVAQRRIDVLIGIESEDRVEILEGLEAGQMIIGE
ncbi:MAG: HlyD family efflux transporter periplasmic adaptor subunit [Chloroflexi bacterium]|nr:HlyD family efflux transporter periplasmic adaptor subunit [Chloroflexota bacterium]